MAYNILEGLAIKTPAQKQTSEDQDDFVFQSFTNAKTPKLDNQKVAPNEQATPITQLQKEILEENSPTISIDSLGFKKIQPLSLPQEDELKDVNTSPLHFKRSTTIESHEENSTPLVSNSHSANTLNTFYSAHSIHSSASGGSRGTQEGFKDEDGDVFESSLNVHALQDDDSTDGTANHSGNTTLDTETLLEDINSPVASGTTSPRSIKNEPKFLVFTNQFTNSKHVSALTTKTTASSYYGEYNDGYLNNDIDNDRTPIISKGAHGSKFENVIQHEIDDDAEEYDDLNRTPLVRQQGFEKNATPNNNAEQRLSTTPPSTTASSSITKTVSNQAAQAAPQSPKKPNQKSPSGEAVPLKKANSGKFLSKFRRKIKSSNNHTRNQSVNESIKSQVSDKDDLTSMDHDTPVIREESYMAYAASVSPPPPPPQTTTSPPTAPTTSDKTANVEDVDDFNFVSPNNIANANDGTSTHSTLDQKSHSTAVMKPLSEELEDDDDLYHAFKPKGKTIDQLLTPTNTANGSLGAHAQIIPAGAGAESNIEQYEDEDEVHIEQLHSSDYAKSVDNKRELKLSPAKSIRKSSPTKEDVKSPNELNKDIFEKFRPSYYAVDTIASPTSSYYTDNISPATNEFSVSTSQLDKHHFFSPTESTFSSTNEKRHTQVKLLNRSTTNLHRVHNNNNTLKEADEEEEEEEVPLKNASSQQQSRKMDVNAPSDDIERELANHEDDNYARLFLTATHPFDAQTLESKDEAARCLSFKKDDIAFIHDISESSGWAEVTLLSYKIETGWVPLNYFKPTIDDDDKAPLLLLFKSAGNFLSNRQTRPIYSSRTGELKGYSFPYTTIDKITVGVKYFLKEIGCLSSKNDTVHLSKIIREVRKKLLQDWHILRQKSREYVGTMNISKIELLELLVYQVLMKAIMFLNIWKSEKVFKPKTNLKRFEFNVERVPYLQYTPTLRERVKEGSSIFFSYFSMIIGRMDLIEHNLTGVNLLRITNDQVRALYADFAFVITESAKRISDERYLDFLDSFGKLIMDFDRDANNLIALTKREYEASKLNYANAPSNNATYAYTQSGKRLLLTCAKLIIELSKIMSIEIVFARDHIKDKLEHPYPDFQRVKIDPKDFIQQASIGLIESNKFNEQIKKRRAVITPKSKSAKRFSVFRNGNSDSLMLTPEGVDLLNDIIKNEEDNDMSPMFNETEFKNLTDDDHLKENPYYIKNLSNEIMKDTNGVLIGSSFRGLVYFLTNELDEPSQLYISTFFLCFKIFSSGEDLLDVFITRFESDTKEIQSAVDIRTKNRRKLVLKMITIWLSSYWNKKDDFKLLPKLMNFLNESASDYLPLETLQLIKLVATLISTTDDRQLISRPLLPPDEKQDKRFSTIMMSEEDDDYELTMIHSNDSLNSLASISSSVLSKSDIQEIESTVNYYKNYIGPNWATHTSLTDLISNWYHLRTTRLRFPTRPLALLNYHSLDVAKQLTLIESELFNNIRLEELLNENFTEKKLHLNLSPNVHKSILFTNSLSEYVLETILQPDINLKQRVKVLTKWLKVALNCFNLKNFNSLAAIMTSLQSFLISRCIEIWAALNGNYKKLFDKLIKIIQPDKNYLIYRRKLLNYLNDKDQIIVPYLNLFLQDLTFIVEGNSNFRSAKTFLNQKLINIDKYFKITKILGDLQRLQKNYKTTSSSSSINNLKKSTSSNKIRKSLSRLSLSLSSDINMEVTENLPLQELVFLEMSRIRQLNAIDDDRSWKLSCLIHPREN